MTIDSTATSRATTKNGNKGLSLDDLLALRQKRSAAAKTKPSFEGKGVDGEEYSKPEDPTAVSWEQQLHTMAGVGPGPDVSARNMSSSFSTERGEGAGQKSNAGHSTAKKVRTLSTLPVERYCTHTQGTILVDFFRATVANILSQLVYVHEFEWH